MVAKLVEIFVILMGLAAGVIIIQALVDIMFSQYGLMYELQEKFSITTRPQRKTINDWLSREPYFESLVTAYDPIIFSSGRAPLWTIEKTVRPNGRKIFDAPDITIRYGPEPLFGYRVFKVEPLW